MTEDEPDLLSPWRARANAITLRGLTMYNTKGVVPLSVEDAPVKANVLLYIGLYIRRPICCTVLRVYNRELDATQIEFLQVKSWPWRTQMALEKIDPHSTNLLYPISRVVSPRTTWDPIAMDAKGNTILMKKWVRFLQSGVPFGM